MFLSSNTRYRDRLWGILIGCDCACLWWAGELVCGCRTHRMVGLRKLRPRVELQSANGQGESLGNGAETKRPAGLGDDTFVMLSVPVWKR